MFLIYDVKDGKLLHRLSDSQFNLWIDVTIGVGQSIAEYIIIEEPLSRWSTTDLVN